MRTALLATVVLPITGLATSAYAAVTISTAATKNMSCSAGVCTATAANAVLNASDLDNLLASSNVMVVAGSATGAIDVKAALSWASAKALTLDAYTSIVVDKPVSVAGSGGLTLTTDDGGTGGTLSFGPAGYVTFLSVSDHLTINGAAYTLADSIVMLIDDINNNASGNYALAESYDASADGTYPGAPLGGFNGTFQGLGNTISNLAINSNRAENVGLFGQATRATIAYLHLTKISLLVKHANVGGLVGNLNGGAIVGCSVDGKIEGGPADSVGGLVGLNGGAISNSWSRAKIVAGGSYYAGGLVGYNENAISSSYATGPVSGDDYVGGLVGYDEPDVEQYPGAGVFNSYATAAVTGSVNSIIGGLEGFNQDGNAANIVVSDSYATGIVTARTASTIGGFVGELTSVVADNYWDTTTSGITNASQGCGTPSNCSGVSGLTTSQLQAGLPTGFSSSIWGESPSINGGLPYLLALPPK